MTRPLLLFSATDAGRNRRGRCRTLLVYAAATCGLAHAASRGAAEEAPPPSYSRDIRPLLADKCFACHGFDAAARQGDLRLDDPADAFAPRTPHPAIVPGDPAASLALQRVRSADPLEAMPPPESGKTLSEAERLLLERWIAAGAPYEPHWAFQSPQAVEPPPVAGAEHPIDRFLQARLSVAGVTPAPPADARTRLRRLSLDLTGLPPTPDELTAFLAREAADPAAAWHEAVEERLARPAYAERWARWWLDQARYADSHGYSVDGPRSIWKYRDWVIAAFHRDMPFDQFTIEQLAGDLLPEATESQRIATGFHRNTQFNQEGGVDPEQFRIEGVFDRVATTGVVWLGLTLGCAQCHDHKFDPITQREFYQVFAFFNDQAEPELTVRGPELPGADAAADAAEQPGVPTLVLEELPQPRATHVLIKGDFTRPGEPVAPGTPAALPPLPTGEGRPTRLDLARWIVSRDQPLTARVTVNRVWQAYFGRGLVETEGDFGLQGAPPTHPELLDWLARDFVAHSWSFKHLHRRIVTSHAYQQSSAARPELEETDPLNELVARQRRLRLDAEAVRDAALLASGLLSQRVGGPPVYPPMPEGAKSQGQVVIHWPESTGEDRVRRSLYAFRYRATPPPALSVFDAPDGYRPCTRRDRSNTPLQALALLNDTTFWECATALQQTIEREGRAAAFERCTARRPEPHELRVLEELDSLAAARVLLNLDETITRE